MVETLQPLPPVLQAFPATCFTWAMTALGAGLVFFSGNFSRKASKGEIECPGGLF
jgi:ZIP family zinc transporter